MQKQKKYHGYGSRRMIDVITPDTFTRPMKVVSTVSGLNEEGETAVAIADNLNYLNIDFKNLDYIVLKKHHTEAQAREFHKLVTELIEEDLYFDDRAHFVAAVKRKLRERRRR